MFLMDERYKKELLDESMRTMVFWRIITFHSLSPVLEVANSTTQAVVTVAVQVVVVVDSLGRVVRARLLMFSLKFDGQCAVHVDYSVLVVQVLYVH